MNCAILWVNLKDVCKEYDFHGNLLNDLNKSEALVRYLESAARNWKIACFSSPTSNTNHRVVT